METNEKIFVFIEKWSHVYCIVKINLTCKEDGVKHIGIHIRISFFSLTELIVQVSFF